MIEMFFMCSELFQLLIIYAFADKMIKRRYSQPVTFIGWLLLFILDGVIVLKVNNGILNMVMYYVLMLIILSFLYCSDFQNKIMLVIHIFVYGVLAEFVVYILMSFLGEIKEDMYFLTSALSKIVFSLIVRITIILRKKKDTMNISLKLLLCVFAMPVGTCTGCIIQYFINNGFNDTYLEIVFYLIFIIVNYVSFIMFDTMQQYVIISAENSILEKESEFYYKQCENVQNMWEGLRNLKHDISNQYVCEKLMLQKGEYEELEKHYDDMIGKLRFDEIYSKTGNIKIDSIINYKLTKIAELGAHIICNIKIPKEMKFDNMDMVIIIGNLLDNAMDALKEVQDGKVELNIRYMESNLLLKVSNSYAGNRRKSAKGEYITTKNDKKIHGMGLKSVKRTLEKYNGKLCITEEKNVFSVKLHMCI
ncbi:MAG: GHKL domain-containing protein [Lachnospiraceae bacterium]|nr:GHKL domain-containing protein [Lachnospiraceae bacterium]